MRFRRGQWNMKGRTMAGMILTAAGAALAAASFFAVCFALAFFSPFDTAFLYGDLNQYERAEAELIGAEQFSDGTVSLTLNELSGEPSGLYTECFACPENARILQENGFFDLPQGTRAEILLCPYIFYDGGTFPVVSVAVNGEAYLSEEEGLANQAEWSQLRDEGERDTFRKIMIPSCCTLAISVAAAAAGIVLLARRRKRSASREGV